MIFKKLVIFSFYFRTWRFHFIFEKHFPAILNLHCPIECCVGKLKNRFQTSTRFTVWNLPSTGEMAPEGGKQQTQHEANWKYWKDDPRNIKTGNWEQQIARNSKLQHLFRRLEMNITQNVM